MRPTQRLLDTTRSFHLLSKATGTNDRRALHFPVIAPEYVVQLGIQQQFDAARWMQFPFAHLNLRKNPFGAVTPKKQGQLAVVDIDEHIEYLEKPGRVLQFVGAHGRGKTTHLLAINQRLETAWYFRASRQEGSLEVPDRAVIIADEVQFLSRRQQRGLFRPDRSYVVSTHDALDGLYEERGLQWKTIELTGLAPDKLVTIADRRIEAVRRESGPIPRLTKKTADALIEYHGDDLRSIEEHLYDVFQQLETIGDVGVDDLTEPPIMD